MSEHCLTRENLKQSPGDFALFRLRFGKNLSALFGNYMDDLLPAALPGLRAEVEISLIKEFQCPDSKNMPYDFLSYELSRSDATL